MASRYLLESGSPDGYQLEDGTGVLLLENESVVVDSAAFDVDGQAIGLEWANKYDPAQFDIDGQSITLTMNAPVAVDAATFDIDGQDITLTWTQNWFLTVDSASFSIAGQSIVFDCLMAVGKADLQPAGQDIALAWSAPISMGVDAATFSLSGSDVDLTLTSVSSETFSGGWVESAYERRQAQLKDEILSELQAEQERQELADRLEKVLVQEGSLTQAQADLIRLRGVASKYKRDDLPNRARRALAFAERAQSELAIKLALREIRRIEEEEEYAVLLLMALD